jgi:Flp pilus assembly protein TadG
VRPAPDEGSATVEFALFSLLLLVPFTYVLLTVFQIQRAAYGVTQAAREAARAFVTSPSGAQTQERMDAAVDLALRDQGVSAEGLAISVTCSADPCLTPGATITVTIVEQVALPWVPALLGRPTASVTVRAVHVQTVDRYRPERP